MIAICVFLVLFVFQWVDYNRFSLHAMYKLRLVRAYLGGTSAKREEHVNKFTDFSSCDDVQVKDLNEKPLHVVNMALNLVSGRRLAWQERKAASFTVTKLACGSWDLGYRPTERYAGSREKNQGIGLGTAMTISGAAVSPNMGYHSSVPVALLLTFFNVRLGWWLGNPGKWGERTWQFSQPENALGCIFSEAFGLTTEESKYVYLSDGGHFENLGLYEMVRRRGRVSLVV